MVTLLPTHPAMTKAITWFSPPPEKDIQPCPDGLGYLSPTGERLFSAHQILDKVWPHYRPLHGDRPSLMAACHLYAASRFNPTAGAWNPSEAGLHGSESAIQQLIQHPFWEQIEVLAAPLHLRHRRLAVATTADLVVRFRNGGDIGLGICQCGQFTEVNPRRVAAEIGACIALLGDTYSWWPRRAFVLFCSPGEIKVESIDSDQAVTPWVDAINLYKFMAKFNNWEERL